MKDFKIHWSSKDKAFVAIVDEWPGFSALSPTHDGVLAEAKIAAEIYEDVLNEPRSCL